MWGQKKIVRNSNLKYVRDAEKTEIDWIRIICIDMKELTRNNYSD